MGERTADPGANAVDGELQPLGLGVPRGGADRDRQCRIDAAYSPATPTCCAADDTARDRLLAVLESLTGTGAVADVIVGDPTSLWEVRHTIPTITEQMTPVVSFDVSTSRGALTALRATLATRLTRAHPEVAPVELGHYGDGGLHLILPLPSPWPTTRPPSSPFATWESFRHLVLDTVVHDFGGSFSAEHGNRPQERRRVHPLRTTPDPGRRQVLNTTSTHTTSSVGAPPARACPSRRRIHQTSSELRLVRPKAASV